MCAFVSRPEPVAVLALRPQVQLRLNPGVRRPSPRLRCRGKTFFSHVHFFAYLIVFNAVRGGLVYVFWRKTLMFNLILIPNYQIEVGLLLCHRSR